VKTLLNLGCGERCHSEWINIDLTGRRPGVVAHDLTTGIPAKTSSVDAVYHAALFEHLRRNDAAKLLREIYRVLKPGGIVRVGVPDLEKICRTYLEKLEGALMGDKQAASDYDWIMLEMFDQAVRERSGGEMLRYLSHRQLPNEPFIFERIGNEGRKLVESIRTESTNKRPFLKRLLYNLMKTFRRGMLAIFTGRGTGRALEIGRFRLSGEVHHWMYDRFSLGRELEAAGFREPKICSASESSIPEWDRFHLDVDSTGTPNKPDLLFMEATKPSHES
jgi:predicted SAM-dependent methyltransferase